MQPRGARTQLCHAHTSSTPTFESACAQMFKVTNARPQERSVDPLKQTRSHKWTARVCVTFVFVCVCVRRLDLSFVCTRVGMRDKGPR
jgi:hypothetical protein